ncbi:MAG: hypothetical protein AAF639_41515 [Chloroflexota bacterium]
MIDITKFDGLQILFPNAVQVASIISEENGQLTLTHMALDDYMEIAKGSVIYGMLVVDPETPESSFHITLLGAAAGGVDGAPCARWVVQFEDGTPEPALGTLSFRVYSMDTPSICLSIGPVDIPQELEFGGANLALSQTQQVILDVTPETMTISEDQSGAHTNAEQTSWIDAHAMATKLITLIGPNGVAIYQDLQEKESRLIEALESGSVVEDFYLGKWAIWSGNGSGGGGGNPGWSD